MRFILDADASIKLTKIGLIEILASEFNLILTDVVYDEHVIVGMNNNYPDAKIMKELVLKGDVIVEHVDNEYSIYDDFNLDRGETSLLKYCIQNEFDLIISDDEKGIMWGDCGVIKFFINYYDLLQLHFDRAIMYVEDYT